MFRNPTADLLVVLLIVLLIFGPKRLPGLGKQLGHGIREFKDSITGNDEPDSEDRAALTQSTAGTPPSTPGTPPSTAATAPSSEPRPAEQAGSERRS
jgi:sec-independent protein translocase protein TatA